MKTPRRTEPFRGARHSSSCSLLVLAGLGLLATLRPSSGFAQTAIAPAGTVPVLRGVVSGQAIVNSPTQTATGRLLTIDQATQRAIIDWRSFDIAAGSEVNFRQPGTTASVLNRIYSADPSLIQGRLTANGQVLLINQNGILFDRGSQVNVQSLVASSLNITNSRFNSGSLATGGLTSPAFEGGYDDQGGTTPTRPDGSTPGAIRIGGGSAATAAPASLTANAGGSILVIAPRIDNVGGMIAAPDGQVILAAGGKAYLAFPNAGETTLRGFQVEVEAADGNPLNITNLIRNAGTITADRGNVTLAALAVNQEGRVSARTAIQANGSIFLQARTLGGAQSGTVTLGSGSVTEVMPDLADKATLPESQSFLERRGEIRVAGRTIESRGTLRAAGGKITLDASDASDPSGARVYLDAGSETSVAGNWADVALAENLLRFRVTSNELRDSPDQRTGLLRGATVTVDLRRGSPLLDLTGYIAAQGRTVGEKAATGGELNISSSGSVIQRSGAVLDASGGGYRYAGGTVATSQLLGDDGKVYDISRATEQRTYTQLLDTFTQNFSRWGQTRTYSGLIYGAGRTTEAAYSEGKAGGLINIVSGAGLVLDGTLRGGATAGPTQLAAAPRGASLVLGAFDATSNEFSATQRLGNVAFANTAGDRLGINFNVASALAPAQVDTLVLAANQVFAPAAAAGRDTYVQQAFDSVEINANGRVAVPEGVTMQGAPGSSLLVRSPRIDVAGTIAMPAGAITLQPVSTQAPYTPDLAGNVGVTLQGSGRLSATGSWINTASSDGSFVGAPLPSARVNVVVASDGPTTTTTSSTLSGGRVVVAASADRTSATVLERGSAIDVGGGAAIDNRSRITAGDGGSISIANGLSNAQSSDWLQADLSGFAAGNGGKLVISTPRVTIDPAGANGTIAADTTRLTPGLFSDHGFSGVTVSAISGITVGDGTTLTLRQTNRVIDPVAASALASGGDLRTVSEVQTLRDDQRRPVNLTLGASGFGTVQGQATVDIAAGASILADPRAAIAISAVDGLRDAGRILAPGGTVALNLSASSDIGAPDLLVAPAAVISVQGGFVRRPTDSGLVQGSVFDAGSITIAASNAGVNLARGSQLELSGVGQTVETIPTGSTTVQRQVLDGNAGSLVVRSQGATALDATLHAARGSEHGAGGSFALELNARGAEFAPPVDRRIVVTQQAASASVADPAFVDATVAIDTLHTAGFERLRLQSENRIELRGDTTLDFRRGIRLDAPVLEVTRDGRAVLEGATVALGQSRDPRATISAPYTLSQQGVSPVRPARAGNGILSVQADTIDLFGSINIDGVAETRLFSAGDIRMTGRNVRPAGSQGDQVFGQQVGSLTTAGNVVLNAAQVYPSTRSDYTISVADASGTPRSGGFISVAGNGAPAGDVYSAGGRLALAADTIVQAGTVKAPLGEIDLNAVSRLELAPGSLTSVSASGLTIPFGTTTAGQTWAYQDNLGGGTRNPLQTTSADAKNISLSGQAIDVRAGARVDLAGGGDIQALEFVPGSGGSRNTLVQPNTYAIIPRAQLTSMPVDTDIAASNDIGFGLQSARADAAVYDRLRIGSGAVVPAGDYVLLPGRYAVLPGAFLVQLQTGAAYTALQSGQTTQLANGQVVVAGQRIAGGTDIAQSSTVGVVVRPGSVANRESDFTATGSSYFADLATQQRIAAPRLPIDAGRLGFTDVASLRLDGTFATAAGTSTTAGVVSTGRTAEVDIAADRIAVVDRAGNTSVDANALQLESRALSSLGGSLLLGGTRTTEADGVHIASRASEVVVANSSAAPLEIPELLITANDRVEVRAGSVLSGRGTANGTQVATLHADPSGALLRLSSGGQASVDRGANVDASRGTLQVDAGATLNADGALLLDATRTTQSQGRFNVAAGGSVALASSQVSLGETAGVSGLSNGLVLSNNDLAGLAALDNLQIKAYQGIDLYGDARVGSATLGRLVLDSGEIRGRAIGAAMPAARIDAREIQLVDSGTPNAATALPATGTLMIAAERLVVGAGAQRIAGYGAVAMNASSEVVASGVGSLDVAGDWTVRTPRVGVAAGADQQWRAADRSNSANPVYGALRLDAQTGPAGTTGADAAGGRIALEGRSVDVATTVQARSGSIAVTAFGSSASDGVTVAAGGVLDASGTAKDYNGHVVTADAGIVSLAAASGAVTVAAGGKVDVAANAAGGDAGRLDVTAVRFDSAGTIAATASSSGLGGRARLDLGSVADISALDAALARGGFDEAIELRVRTGDVRIAAGDTVRARSIQIAADAGRIDIAGTLDARSTRGDGSVELDAATGLALAAGSRMLASGTATSNANDAPLSDGGRVRIATNGGTLDFAAGSAIDVSPGAKGATGSVTFVASRDAANVVAPVNLAGTVLGRSNGTGTLADVGLEAQRSYVYGSTAARSVSAADITGYGADHAAFIANTDVAALLGSLRADGGAAADAHLRGATEIRTAGDLRVAQPWNLVTPQWRANDQPGTLTLRAGGDLTVSSSLGMINDTIIDGRTWNLRLVAGADLGAADAMTTLSPQAAAGRGSVLLQGNAARVRTGTGSVDIAAAQDFRMDSAQSAVYTAGRVGAVDTAASGNNRWSRDGGDITVRAGHDAIGASDEWITEWLRRPRSADTTTPAEWWSYRPNFQQGLGTLGGGDVTIDAGHDVNRLAAMLPTTGRSHVDAAGVRVLDVQGGGNLAVTAGHDVIGGSYLVARGEGRIDAGGSVGSGMATQFYLMGTSSGAVPEQASIEVTAGGSVALQSVNNPTALQQVSTSQPPTSREPSFGRGATSVATFFSYSANSTLNLAAESGDVSVGSQMANGRALGSATSPLADLTGQGAYPASIEAAALGGNVSLVGVERLLVTYPSAVARVFLLADATLTYPNLAAGDLLERVLPSTLNPVLLTESLTGNFLYAAGQLTRFTPADRIVDRAAGSGYAFDLQALRGDIEGLGAIAANLTLPAASRIRAGRDIDNVRITLQNLNATDTSLIRADNGDVLTAGVEMRGPGSLVVQAGRNVDVGAADIRAGSSGLGALVSTGSNANPALRDSGAARLVVIAGVKGDVDPTQFAVAYRDIIGLGGNADLILGFYRALNGDPDRAAVTSATGIQQLVARDPAYAPYAAVVGRYPRLLGVYQDAIRTASLPLGNGADASQAAALYALLNRETDAGRIAAAGSVADLVTGTLGGAAYQAYTALDQRFPRVFADYRARRTQGATPEGLTPILLSDALAEVTNRAVPAAAIGAGNIYTFQSSIQTYGNSQPAAACALGQCPSQGDIELWAPGGKIVAGTTTTPPPNTTFGVVTNGGGAIRSVVAGNFDINQGKVLTAQGGDLLLFSSGGSIDAGRGARTSISTPPPTRTPILDETGNQIGLLVTLPASASGSGIQTVTSDPDGSGPRLAPPPGNVYLFAPAGTIDAGEAGIRSSGNLVINAQTVLNASNISSAGTSAGVPVVASGSLASAVASSGTNTSATSKAAEDTAAAAAAARAATAATVTKPNILSVEVLGFGDKNCKEQDKDCFAK